MKTYEQEYIQHQNTTEAKPETPPGKLDSEKNGPRIDAIRSLLKHALDDMDKLAEALQWIKEVVSERKGTAMWAQMVEDKARNALRELEKARQQ